MEEKKTLEQVMKEFKLTDEEHDEIQRRIFNKYLYNKHPVKNPQAIVDIAPPASGNTGLNSYGVQQFRDGNVVVINSDELKLEHPRIDEIAKKYPEYYTKVTDQESNTWTSTLFDEALKNGYNVIFEGTGRNARILDTIKEKMKGYKVTVRGMAVDKLNCLMSILERYWEQSDRLGWGRLVTLDHFYETYKNMPETIDKIEKSGIVDSVQILKRGGEPHEPVEIYDSAKSDEIKRFPTAKYAIFGGRKEDEIVALNYFKVLKGKMEERVETKEGISEEEKRIFNEIEKLARQIESGDSSRDDDGDGRDD